MDSVAEQLVRRFERIKSDRVNFETLWDEMAFFCLPYKQDFISSRLGGQSLPPDLYDDVGKEINLMFSAGLSAYMTNQSTEWFYLDVDDERFRDYKPAQMILQEIKEEAYYLLNHSNFYSQVHENYLEFNPFGNVCLYSKPDPIDSIRFHAKSMSNVYFAEDHRHDVNTMFDVYKMTAEQADKMFNGKAGETVKGKLEAKKFDDYVTFLNVVLPRHNRVVGKVDAINKPFASYWIEVSKKELVFESGYDWFPFSTARGSRTSNSAYGWSPLMMQVANLRSQNKIQADLHVGSSRSVSPAIILPSDDYLTPLSRRADAINLRQPSELPDNRGLEVIPTGNVKWGLEFAQYKIERIRQATFVDVFLMLAQQTGNKTATEVIEQVNEKRAMLSFLTNNFFPYHSKNIEQVINIGFKEGRMPEIPPELQGMQYTIKYSSPLARAQKLSESRSYQDYLAFVGSLSEVKPEILDIIDAEAIGRKLAKMYNIPAEFLNDREKVEAIRQARMEQAEMEQKIQTAGAGAQIAKTAMEADRLSKEKTA